MRTRERDVGGRRWRGRECVKGAPQARAGGIVTLDPWVMVRTLAGGSVRTPKDCHRPLEERREISYR